MPELLRIIRPQDVIDIFIMTFLVYQLYSWFKNTKAIQVVVGLGVLGVLYFVTRQFGLFMTSWILQELGTVLFVLVIVVFQVEIRQALYRFSLLRSFAGGRQGSRGFDIKEVASTIFSFAREMTGALIVFQRKENLDEHLLHGVSVDGVVSGQLLHAIFQKNSPLHDGAVIIRDDRIVQASCHLPLSTNTELPHHYGTRHRAGVGISERSDALAIIVSEESGEVSIAKDGSIRKIANSDQLCTVLASIVETNDKEKGRLSIFQAVRRNMVAKLTIFLLVIFGWVVISGRQGGIVTVTAPVKFRNLPENLSLVKGTPEEVEVQLKVFTSFTSSPRELDVVADVNLADVHEGTNTLAIGPVNVRVPLGAVINTISPSSIKVVVGKKANKQVRVLVNSVGKLGRRLSLRTEPSAVTIVGPEDVLKSVDFVRTEQINLSTIRRPGAFEKNLLQPAQGVQILQPQTVIIRAVRGGS